MHQVDVTPVPLARLEAVLPPDRAAHLEVSAARARASFGDRVVWHVSATAQGGGVAEMLQNLLGYGRGAGIDTRWLVIDGDPGFFTITKRVHNMLHGDPGDGGSLGAAERDQYDAVLATNLAKLMTLVSSGDIVVLHDPQTAGLARGLRKAGLRVVWRCHVGRDEPCELSLAAWEFLRPYLCHVDEFVFSRAVYAPSWVDPDRLWVIPPSIDPFSAKNRDLPPETVESVLAAVGLVSGGEPDDEVRFERRDGSTGTVPTYVRTRGLVIDGDPPPPEAPLIVQISRWDRLKSMQGVMDGFALLAARRGEVDAHLVLAGPAVRGVTDDPEGARVLDECRAAWFLLPDAVRERVHLASIPMDDVEVNAVVVNALQRHAFAVVQKSLVEGFGLTVTEAMWKGKPVIASRVGGIQDQIVDGLDGILLDDPSDLDGFAAAMARLLDARDLAQRLGDAARARVRRDFVGDRHLEQYVELFSGLVSTPTHRPG